MFMTMFTFTIAIDDKTLFWRIENYHAQETSSLTTLLLLVLQKTRVPVFLVEMKCGRGSLCDIRRDCCHNFVSEHDFKHNAQ